MSKRPKTADRHKSDFMVRLPNEFRTCLDQLKKTTRRGYTVEVQLALEAYFKANGIKFPPT